MIWTGWVSPSSGLRRALRKSGAAVVVAASFVAGGVAPGVLARTPDKPSRVAAVALVTLPAEAQATHRLILAGGPFPYAKDGSAFGNRERLLPVHPRGFYREYTVKTPGARNRGAQRIVCGGQAPTQPEACYYTADHYASFQRIAP